MATASELSINTGVNGEEMANAIFGGGVKVVGAKYYGDENSSGIYSGADTTMPDVAPSDAGVILSTGYASSVTNSSGDVNTSSGTSTDTTGVDGDADLNSVAGFSTYDASILEATFIPDGNVLTMQIVFSSEEYLEYVGSGFNDAVGIWVNGVPAELVVGDGSVSIDNINDTSNPDLYIDNASSDDTYNTEMDGFTVTLSLKAPVKPGEENTIKIGIADAGDSAYDSNLFIAADSLQTVVIAEDDEYDVWAGGQKTIDVLENDNQDTGGTLSITHINGQPVSAGDTVVLSNGVELTLTSDGEIQVLGDDQASEVTFTYGVTDGLGNTDVGYTTINTVPCFLAGTVIDTARGPLPIDDIAPGDLVLTRDHGYQPVRWAGRQSHDCTDRTAPVQIEAGTFGLHGTLIVSPQHRVLIEGPKPELLFAAPEVLVSAVHLIGQPGVRRWPQDRTVTYVHLLFDQHEVLRSNGMWSESYLPGPQTMPGFSAEVQAELCAIFPQLDPVTGEGFGPTARLCLKRYEAQALVA